MPLTDLERRVVSVIDENWMTKSQVLSPDQVATMFGTTLKKASEILTKDEVKSALKGRGIPVGESIGLTPDQVTTINAVMNPMDTRSRRKILQESGISPKVWDGWLKSPTVRNYMKVKAEQLLVDAIPEAHMALVDNVLRGEFSSIKFLYEMTGHYTGQQQPVDINSLTHRILEILQIHIKDPALLLAISQDLLGLADSASINPNNSIIQGEVTETPVANLLEL